MCGFSTPKNSFRTREVLFTSCLGAQSFQRPGCSHLLRQISHTKFIYETLAFLINGRRNLANVVVECRVVDVRGRRWSAEKAHTCTDKELRWLPSTSVVIFFLLFAAARPFSLAAFSAGQTFDKGKSVLKCTRNTHKRNSNSRLVIPHNQ